MTKLPADISKATHAIAAIYVRAYNKAVASGYENPNRVARWALVKKSGEAQQLPKTGNNPKP